MGAPIAFGDTARNRQRRSMERLCFWGAAICYANTPRNVRAYA